MFHWKLSRKQKLLRNIVVMLAALGSLWWMLGFPALTINGLQRRAEQAYLLDEKGGISMIFCVEDDANIRKLIVYTLQSTGFEAQGFHHQRFCLQRNHRSGGCF